MSATPYRRDDTYSHEAQDLLYAFERALESAPDVSVFEMSGTKYRIRIERAEEVEEAAEPELMQQYDYVGTVDDSGGGKVQIHVDRDLGSYPENGARMYVGTPK